MLVKSLMKPIIPFQLLLKKMKKNVIHFKFWFKTALYYYTPGGYGYYRRLNKYKESNYVRNVKYKAVSQQNKESNRMDQLVEKILYRDYENYDEYTRHQQSKFDMLLKEGKSFNNFSVAQMRYFFYLRFRRLYTYLPLSAVILCAGARQGTEVEVLHDLGFRNAYGIDLNPGPNNKFVRPGDFMHLDNPDSSLDMVYCNAVDHAFNLEDFFSEHARAIKPNGYALYDISLRSGGGFESVEWESAENILTLLLHYFNAVITIETYNDIKWILVQGTKSS